MPVAEEKPEQRVQGLRGKHMVLDGATVANLELLKNSTGGQEAALINLFSPVTAMGKRLLTQWILSPLLQPKAIKARQGAVKDLMDSEHLGQVKMTQSQHNQKLTCIALDEGIVEKVP